MIINPTHFTNKTSYNSQKPLSYPNPLNLTSKVQEISIDQTWFKRRDPETIPDTEEDARILTEKGDAAEAISFEIEEVIEKQCAKDSESRISRTQNEQELEHMKSDSAKLDKFLQHSINTVGVNNNENELNDNRLSRIEQLIQPSEKLNEFDNKSVLDRTAKPVPLLRHTNSSSSAEGILGPDFVPVKDKHFQHSRSDSCTTSVCSTCSLVSTLPSRSRCSSGDGCSSVECDGIHKTCVQSEGIHRRNYTICYLHGPSYNYESGEPVGDLSAQILDNPVSNRENTENVSPDGVDCCNAGRLTQTTRLGNRPQQSHRLWKQHIPGGEEIELTDSLTGSRYVKNKRNSFSEMQLMFYIIKLHANKYGELKSLIEAQNVSLTQQGQSIDSLVQCVTLLSVRLHQQTSSLDCLTKLLKRQEVERRRRQTIVFTTMLGIVVICMLHQDSVQGKIAASLRMFGITRQLKSFRRTKRMVSEIWRDIPPLLTNFWRIFIFKGRTD